MVDTMRNQHAAQWDRKQSRPHSTHHALAMSTEESEIMSFGDAIRAEWLRLGLISGDLKPEWVSTPPSPKEMVRNQRMQRFREFCPEEFQKKIVRELIPNVAAWDKADLWTGGHPGVWLWSHDTGEAKSRMLWRKFGQLHVDNGKTVCRVTGANLAEEYHDAFNKSRTGQFYRDLTGFEVVMLDDLDKMPLPRQGVGFAEHDQAERNARMLRELFDRFYESHTPVLVTSNEGIAWFGQRIGPSAERRMRECCTEIEF